MCGVVSNSCWCWAHSSFRCCLGSSRRCRSTQARSTLLCSRWGRLGGRRCAWGCNSGSWGCSRIRSWVLRGEGVSLFVRKTTRMHEGRRIGCHWCEKCRTKFRSALFGCFLWTYGYRNRRTNLCSALVGCNSVCERHSHMCRRSCKNRRTNLCSALLGCIHIRGPRSYFGYRNRRTNLCSALLGCIHIRGPRSHFGYRNRRTNLCSAHFARPQRNVCVLVAPASSSPYDPVEHDHDTLL